VPGNACSGPYNNTAGNGEPTGAGNGGNDVGSGLDSSDVVDQPVKQRARLRLAQILYKEARRRRQKYVEELQIQQE